MATIDDLVDQVADLTTATTDLTTTASGQIDRLTVAAAQAAADAGAATGNPLGDYATGLVFNSHNDYTKDDVLYKLKDSVGTPYTTNTATYPLATDDPNLVPWSNVDVLKSIALALNVPREAILNGIAGQEITAEKEYLYNPDDQTTRGIPALNSYPETIVSVSGGALVTSGGSYTLVTVVADKTFNTVADMKTSSSVGVGDLVKTVDYHQTQRGGGATYLIKTAAQAASDGDHLVDGEGNIQLTDGSWAILQDDGIAYLEQYGLGLSGVDQSTKLQSILFALNDNNKKQIHYNTTIELSNVALTAMKDLDVTAGPDGILDFKHCTGGIGLKIGEGGVGVRSGSQGVVWNNLTMTDSRSTSLCDELFVFSGGTTEQTPFQTSGFLTVNGGKILQYNNTNGIARRLTNVSHVTFNDWEDGYELGCKTSLYMEDDTAINTGVYNFNNCSLRSKVTPIVINAATAIMDTFTFFGGFIGNDEQSAARELILLKGAAQISALNFIGVHMEARDATLQSVIKVEGQYHSGTISGCHISAGTSTLKILHVVNCVGSAQVLAVECSGNEVLRLAERGDGGAIFHFENTVTTNIEQPIKIGCWWNNTTTPDTVLVDAGGNEDNIYKSLISLPRTISRSATGLDRIYTLDDSETPSVKGGIKFEMTSVPTSSQITDFVDEYKGQLITLVNSTGGTVTVVNNAFKIRCKGGVDLVLSDNDAVQFQRTQANHWIQVAELIDTSTQIGLTATNGDLNSVLSDINTKNKIAGKTVLNLDTGATATATGPQASDVWNNSDGTVANTPA